MTIMRVDLAEFTAQMQLNRKLSKKTGMEFLNNRSVQVLIGSKGYKGATSTTKKVSKAQIRKDMNRKIQTPEGPVKLLMLLASQACKKQGLGKGNGRAGWNSAVSQMMIRIYKARDASRAYLAAGWLAAVRQMGHKRRSDNNRSLRPVGTSRGQIGYGTLATEGRLRFEAYNNAVSLGPNDNPSRREQIITKGLNMAIANQISDMKTYLEKKMNEMLLQNSDKK
jgi:hypothetical protein